MKGIILAGGLGTRLYPLTKSLSKQLMPVYDKPMIYYPLSVLMMAGLRDILVISTPQHLPLYREQLEDGEQWGLRLRYAEQPRPDGLARAFVIAEEFIGADPVALILGDNIFFGDRMAALVQEAAELQDGARIFCYRVKDPQRYGVVELDDEDRIVALHEKPASPPSNYAITGLYFYGNDVVRAARELEPSVRGEYEITDLNRRYLDEGRLEVEILGRGIAWLDTGTHDSLLQAANFVETVESRQGLRIACLEEIAWRMGFIDTKRLGRLAERMQDGQYAEYLHELLEREGRRGEGSMLRGRLSR